MAICKKCHAKFDFGATYQYDVPPMSPYLMATKRYFTPISSMTFPEGKIEKITIKCPHCETVSEYQNDELLKPPEVMEMELKVDRESSSKLKSENESLKAKVEGLETEIQRLRKNNDTLTENNRILAHVIEDDRMKEANSSTSGGQGQSG